MKRPTVCVLIVSWNGRDDLRRNLRSLAAMSYGDYYVLVVDNGSTDGSPAEATDWHARVELLCNATNLGHTRGVNQGLAAARADYVLLLDADTVVERDTVRALVDFMHAHPAVDVAAPRILHPSGAVEESARNLPTALSGLFGRQSLLTRLFPDNRFSRVYLARQNLFAREPFRVQQVSSACMLIRSTLIADAGPWDQGYEGYFCDTDWCRKLAALGKTIYCVPGARITHYSDFTVRKRMDRRRVFMFHRGAFRYFYKHHTWGALDPRAWAAAVLLALRAAAVIAAGSFHGARVAELRGEAGARQQR